MNTSNVQSITRFVAFGFALALAAACAATRAVDTWTASGLSPDDLAFEHVVAIAALQEVSRQRVAEDALASAITRTKVTPAYQLMDQAERADAERLRAVLDRNGVDGAITVRLVGIEDKQTYVPGSARTGPGGYYGYWGRVGAGVYAPGYYRTDTYVTVETTLYDVAGARLLWAGTSRTFNPQNIDAVIAGVVAAAAKDLRTQGLIE